MRDFIIHAGTHKTATSYIQSRLIANRDQLLSLGVKTDTLGREAQKHKPLAAALRRKQWHIWTRYLERFNDESPVLVSAEQFTQPLSQPSRLGPLKALLKEKGYQLKVVVYLRDQPDYMNARYVHSTRRLYHCLAFEPYVRQQLRHRAHIFDYELLFTHLMQDDEVEISFIPYSTSSGDPFERLMQHLGWKHGSGWLPATQDRGNIQPGCRGVWLAQQISERLKLQGQNPKRLKNTGALVRRIAHRERWSQDRYFGFSEQLAERVRLHYQEANDRFANKAWGKPWRDIFTGAMPPQRVYQLPETGPEHDAMMGYLNEAMSDLSGKSRKP